MRLIGSTVISKDDTRKTHLLRTLEVHLMHVVLLPAVVLLLLRGHHLRLLLRRHHLRRALRRHHLGLRLLLLRGDHERSGSALRWHHLRLRRHHLNAGSRHHLHRRRLRGAALGPPERAGGGGRFSRGRRPA